jgi:peroxiredoxin
MMCRGFDRAMNTLTPEMQSLRLKSTWEAGDHGRFAKYRVGAKGWRARAMIGIRTLLLAVAGLAVAEPPSALAAQEAQPGVGQIAPEFALTSLEGKPVTLSQFQGRFVVIHFAATWCPFCNAELPHLVALDKAYRDKGVQVLIIDIGERKTAVERTARKFGVAFPVLLDTDGTVAKRYAPPKTVQPDLGRDEVMVAANLLLDREGRIRFFSVLDTAQFDAKLVALRAVLDDLLAAR